jgi:Fanconi anemia group J protein
MRAALRAVPLSHANYILICQINKVICIQVLQIPATDRKSRDRLHQIGKLAKFSSYMMNFMDNTAKSVLDDETIMTGKELVEKFTVENYGPNILAEISFVVEVIFNEQNGGRSSGTSPIKVEEGEEKVESESKLIDTKLHLLAKTRATLEDFLMIVNLMVDDEQTHLDDYQVAIVRSKKRNMKIEASNGY